MNPADTDTKSELPATGYLPTPNPRSHCVVRSFGMTDTGRIRFSNEDHFVIAEMSRNLCIHHTSVPQSKTQYSSYRGHLFLVADGMGGHQAGEVASAISVVSVEDFLLNTVKRFFRLKESDEQCVMKEFQAALQQADARIFEEATHHPELAGMGTTLTMAFAINWRLFVAHAGDSRCYLYSKGKLQQLTQDHTMVAEMIRMGILSPKEASRHPDRNVITNVLGGRELGVQVEMHRLDLEPGDVLLLCSDGLNGMVPDTRIAELLQEEREPQRTCERLVAEANANGGKDNITVVVACFDEAN